MMMARGDAAVVVPNIMFRLAFIYLAVAAPTHWRKTEEAYAESRCSVPTYQGLRYQLPTLAYTPFKEVVVGTYS